MKQLPLTKRMCLEMTKNNNPFTIHGTVRSNDCGKAPIFMAAQRSDSAMLSSHRHAPACFLLPPPTHWHKRTLPRRSKFTDTHRNVQILTYTSLYVNAEVNNSPTLNTFYDYILEKRRLLFGLNEGEVDINNACELLRVWLIYHTVLLRCYQNATHLLFCYTKTLWTQRSAIKWIIFCFLPEIIEINIGA